MKIWQCCCQRGFEPTTHGLVAECRISRPISQYHSLSCISKYIFELSLNHASINHSSFCFAYTLLSLTNQTQLTCMSDNCTPKQQHHQIQLNSLFITIYLSIYLSIYLIIEQQLPFNSIQFNFFIHIIE